jgi:type IV secretory pathway VirB4 component
MGAAPRRPFRATTHPLMALNPFNVDGGLGVPGVFVGRDALAGGSFEFDPWELMRARLVSGPNMLIIGQIGYAKSSLVKTWLNRRSLYVDHSAVGADGTPKVARARIRLIDPKGEYDPVAALWGIEPVRFYSGGSLRLNPLDPVMADDAQLSLLSTIAAVCLKRDLRPAEDAGLQQAHTEAILKAQNRGQPATIPLVIGELLEPSAAVALELRAPPERIAEDNRELALALKRLTGRGDLGGMFDEPTSKALNLHGQKLIFNLRGVKDAARPILMACMAASLQAEWAQPGRVDKDIVVLEEAWAAFQHLAIARWFRELEKLARQLRVMTLFVTHRLSDLTAAGDDGSEKVKLAQGMLEDTELRVIYRQTPKEVEHSAELLGLSDVERQLLPTLHKGEALWKIATRSFLVRHVLSPREERLVFTDEALRIRGQFEDDEAPPPRPDPAAPVEAQQVMPVPQLIADDLDLDRLPLRRTGTE